MKKITLAMICTLAIFLAGCNDYAAEQIPPLLTTIASGEAAAIAEIATAESAQQYGAAQMIERYEKLHSALAVTGITLVDMAEDEAAGLPKTLKRYRGEVVLATKFGDIRRPLAIDFAYDKAEKRWQLVWTPELIIPGLRVDNALRIETSQAAVRGEIYDRHGHILAGNGPQGRYYPLDKAGAHLLGYIGSISAEELAQKDPLRYTASDLVGKRGLEQFYEAELHPQMGLQVYLTGEGGDVFFAQEPQNGIDIHTTIDSRVMQAAYGILAEDDASVAALNPQTGEILALVSTPSFSPNALIQGMSHSAYQALVDDRRSPLVAKFQNPSSPGSTQKLLTALIGLKQGVLTPAHVETIHGKTWQPGTYWGGYAITRAVVYNGTLDLEKAIVLSDNIYFARAALAIGGEGFVKGMNDLGVGEQMAGDYPFGTGQVAQNNVIDREILLADSGYGQGQISISPLQLAAIYGAIPAQGQMMTPHLQQKTAPLIWKADVAKAADVAFLAGALRKVVAENHQEAERSYAQIAGKTGTAETKQQIDEKAREVGWFVGYDAANPNLVLAVRINHVENIGGSAYAARKFAQIFDQLYQVGPYTP